MKLSINAQITLKIHEALTMFLEQFLQTGGSEPLGIENLVDTVTNNDNRVLVFHVKTN